MSVSFRCRTVILLVVAAYFVVSLVLYAIHRLQARTTVAAAQNIAGSGAVSITVTFSGRLGNHMFQYASLLGIARRNNMTANIPPWLDLYSVFDLNTHLGGTKSLVNYVSYEENGAAKFNSYLIHLPRRDTLLTGYLQSFKYFDFMKSELIQKQFHFKENHRRAAAENLHRVVDTRKEKHGWRSQYSNLVIVGIHVRRGDFVRSYTRGYATPPLPYYYRAMNYFRRRFRNVLFVVCSNDITWCKDQLADDSVYFSDSDSDHVDLAIMASCNHTIISAGTFSWWAGYLSNGTVVYYKDHPRPGSDLEKSFNRNDYYPDSWIPL